MTGFIFLIIAGVCQGSFGLGYKKYPPFSWAVFWCIYNMLCAVTALGAAVITSGSFNAAVSAFSIMPVLCGALWGLSSICFSKAITSIGMSMVYGLSMGISTITGSVIPMFMNSSVPQGYGAVRLAVGLVLCVCGIAAITVAGVKRDKKKKRSVIAIVMAVISGLGSGAMNIGFSASVTELPGLSNAAMSAVRWLPVLIGGCVMCVIWCVGEAAVKKEGGTLTEKGAAERTAKLFGISIVWYMALMLYGLAHSALADKIGEAAWALFNALALLVSVAWGLKTGEWKNTSKKILFLGCLFLILSWIFIVL